MIEITEQLVSVVSDQIPGMTEEQVSQVLTALNFVYDGPPVGTIAKNDTTGAVAHRVSDDGVILWRITEINGQVSGSHPAILPGENWTVLFQPAPAPGATV